MVCCCYKVLLENVLLKRDKFISTIENKCGFSLTNTTGDCQGAVWLRPCAKKHAFTTTTTTTSSDSNHRNVNYDCTTLAPLSTALLFDCSRHRSTSPSAIWNVWNVLELGEMTKAGLCMFEF